MAVLGISTNTRLLGLAIIHEGRLLDYSIRLDKSPWSPAKATRIITSLEPCVRQYSIKKAVLSMPYTYHQTDAFKTVLDAIRTFCKQHHIVFFTETPETIYAMCDQPEKRSKKEVMHTLTDLYPQLSYCFQKELKNKKKYYTKLFEAVAVAMLKE
ncbi:hypothetical protein ESA94_13425 [Lacibacter luteus]|uniref:Holliday junction resolvase RuvX n=1 Tax=Lacibacter luteus TaxID=2508719 RepID=A0A4V1M7J0_9BACT|nr:hypothetical protein [Lacibacter luteus]RXK60042.1 hypothetical protein ESA94_13425 [Lacibacter luteus]